MFVKNHAPDFVKEVLTVLTKILIEFELIDVNESHDLSSTLNQGLRNFLEFGIVRFKNKGQNSCDVGKILFVEVWQLFLTENGLNDVQYRIQNLKHSANGFAVVGVTLGNFNAIL